MFSSLFFILCVCSATASLNNLMMDSCLNFSTCSGPELPVNCECDDLCTQYGDCCQDAVQSNAVYALENIWSCHPYSFNRSLMVISKCKKDYKIMSTKLQCEHGGHISDPYSMVMVSNPKTKVTYKNVWCASCNDDSEVVPWEFDLHCNDTDDKNFVYNRTEEAWGIEDFESNTFNKCFFHYTVPDGIKEEHFRQCNPFAIKKCPKNTTEDLELKCLSYNSFVVDVKGHLFGNEYCATCNKINNFECVENTFSNTLGAYPDDSNPGKSHRIQSLGVLLDIISHDQSYDVNTRVTQRADPAKCRNNEMYDYFFHKCRIMRCQPHYTIQGGKCRIRV